MNTRVRPKTISLLKKVRLNHEKRSKPPTIGSTKKIAEALNAKITQLKAKYTQLASSIQNSPAHKKVSAAESKENMGVAAAGETKLKTATATGERKMRRHNSQENIGVSVKSHAGNTATSSAAPKGILKLSTKVNVAVAVDPIKKELFPSKPSHMGKQSLGSVAMKKILDQAKEKDNTAAVVASKEVDVIKNINDCTRSFLISGCESSK